MDKHTSILVCGAGGFIGGHLVAHLSQAGYTSIRAVDVKPLDQWFQHFPECDNRVLDLQLLEACLEAADGQAVIYNLAADMGGMGFIENNKALCMLSVLINTHLLMAARNVGAQQYFYSSSACVYNAEKQKSAQIIALKESDAYPAMPEDGYGWEKLFSEHMCRHFMEDYDIPCRVARFHNVYGPEGTFQGGREKAPAAICRKIIEAKNSGKPEIEIWGDGKQTRSFMYIDDCIEGIQRMMNSSVNVPLNLGSNELVTINQLVDIVEEIAGIQVQRHYNLDAPKGVNGRNSDNTLIKQQLGWAPSTALQTGMKKTYDWIEQEMNG